MKAICVDDEYLVLQLTVSMCKQLPQLDDVRGFTRAKNAIEAIKQEPVQLAILDIDMPDINGIELAMAIKEVDPDIRILFVTGYTEYAVEAFKIHASGYLLKPVSQEQLENEVAHALEGVKVTKTAHIFARTFGNFDLFVDGKPVSFGRTKARRAFRHPGQRPDARAVQHPLHVPALPRRHGMGPAAERPLRLPEQVAAHDPAPFQDAFQHQHGLGNRLCGSQLLLPLRIHAGRFRA